MPSIYDLVTAKEIETYYSTKASNKIPYLGQTLFPRKKQLGLDLSWIKGSKGLPAVLKPSAFDSKVTLRDRIGFDKIDTEMPFFKEGMLIKESDRQELLKVISSGNQAYIDLIVSKVFDDITGLVDGAEAQEERMRMQLLSTGKISIVANRQNLDYDYGFSEDHKEALLSTAQWSDLTNSNPVTDIQKWQNTIEEDTGVKPTRAICTRKTWNYLMNNAKIKLDMNPAGGSNIIMTDAMLKVYIESKLGLTVAVYNKKFNLDGVATQFFPDEVFTLIPDSNLGNTYFGTTPEEADLMSGAEAQVSIVNTGVAITTSKETDPVSVQTKVSMITLPSFENIDQVFIATVA